MARRVFWTVVGSWLLIGMGAGPVRASPITAPAYADPAELAADLAVVAESLTANQAADIAQGRLLDVREAVTSFGFHLAVVDLRQNADVHERVSTRLPRLAVTQIVSEFGGLDELLAANDAELEAVEGIGGATARAVRR